MTDAFHLVRSFALSLPETTEELPWGDRVVKVRGKIFVFLGEGQEEGWAGALKLPQSGPALLARGLGKPTAYNLGKAGWVSLRLHPVHAVTETELLDWVRESYRAVAPRRLAAQIG